MVGRVEPVVGRKGGSIMQMITALSGLLHDSAADSAEHAATGQVAEQAAGTSGVGATFAFRHASGRRMSARHAAATGRGGDRRSRTLIPSCDPPCCRRRALSRSASDPSPTDEAAAVAPACAGRALRPRWWCWRCWPVGYTLWAAQDLLLPVLLAMFFALVGNPIIRLLKRLWCRVSSAR